MTYPPFIAGQRARRAGLPLEANPHGKSERGLYPGPHQIWIDGWTNEDRMIAYDERNAG